MEKKKAQCPLQEYSYHVDNIDEYDFRRKKIDKRKIVKYAIYLYNNTRTFGVQFYKTMSTYKVTEKI